VTDEPIDTSGFYKAENFDLLYGKYVFGPSYSLLWEYPTDTPLPVEGWDWFDTEAEARLAYAELLVRPEEPLLTEP